MQCPETASIVPPSSSSFVGPVQLYRTAELYSATLHVWVPSLLSVYVPLLQWDNALQPVIVRCYSGLPCNVAIALSFKFTVSRLTIISALPSVSSAHHLSSFIHPSHAIVCDWRGPAPKVLCAFATQCCLVLAAASPTADRASTSVVLHRLCSVTVRGPLNFRVNVLRLNSKLWFDTTCLSCKVVNELILYCWL